MIEHKCREICGIVDTQIRYKYEEDDGYGFWILEKKVPILNRKITLEISYISYCPFCGKKLNKLTE